MTLLHDTTSRRAVLAAALAAAFVAACGSNESRGNGKLALVASSKKRVVPGADAPVAATVSGMTDFGTKLFGLVAEPTKNAVVSPMSIAYAFGMARVGARGETAAEIDEVLGFPADPHPAFNRLSREIVTTTALPPKTTAKRKPGDEPKPPIVAIANGLFVQRDVEVGRAFLDTLAEEYGAGVRTVDFKSMEALALINAWVREQTAERIEKLFDKLDGATKLVLANAVYLKADWVSPFAMNPTSDETFHSLAGEITVSMMHGLASRRHAIVAECQAVELPYFGDELAMWLLVPTGKAKPAELLAPVILGAVADSLEQKSVDLSMPRWDFATDLDLVPLLRKLGMVAPFDNADFSGMLPDVFIGQAVHRANITVDEWGTEAAAVTGLAFPTSGRPEPAVKVRADRPFAFAIMHLPTRTPLFLGQVVDPTAS